MLRRCPQIDRQLRSVATHPARLAFMPAVEAIIANRGGVAHRSVILAGGATPFELGRAFHSGRIMRVRRAWYATPDAPPDVVRAVRVGGALTAVSAGASHGLWSLPDGALHVAVPRNSSRLRSQHSRFVALNEDHDSTVCLHWRHRPGADVTTVEPLIDVLIHALECQPEERAIVLVDSALNQRAVTMAQLGAAFACLPRRYRRALSRVDPASESGTETLVRLRLRRRGISVRSQVWIDGVGRVDLLVGERLVIECDSRAHHTGRDAYQRDRARDLALVAAGYVVIRLTYEQILTQWDRIEPSILRMVRRNEHMRPRTRRLTA